MCVYFEYTCKVVDKLILFALQIDPSIITELVKQKRDLIIIDETGKVIVVNDENDDDVSALNVRQQHNRLNSAVGSCCAYSTEQWHFMNRSI